MACTYVRASLICVISSRKSPRAGCWRTGNDRNRFVKNQRRTPRGDGAAADCKIRGITSLHTFNSKYNLTIANSLSRYFRYWELFGAAPLIFFLYGEKEASTSESLAASEALLLRFLLRTLFTRCGPYSGKRKNILFLRLLGGRRNVGYTRVHVFPFVLSSRASERLYSSVIVTRFEFV